MLRLKIIKIQKKSSDKDTNSTSLNILHNVKNYKTQFSPQRTLQDLDKIEGIVHCSCVMHLQLDHFI